MSLEHRPGFAMRGVVATLAVLVLATTAGLAAFPGSNGRIAAETSRTFQLRVVTMNPDGTDLTFLTNNAVMERFPAWSPDGTKIAFAVDVGGSGHYEIWVINEDGSSPRRLLASPSSDTQPAWSPDGLRIAFTRDDPVTHHDDIWVASAADGSGLTRLTTTDDADESQAAWSPDGSKIAFVTNRDGDSEIYAMSANGSGAVNLTQSPTTEENAPDWAPDGSFIVFDSYATDPFSTRLFLMAADGSGQQEVEGTVDGDQQPAVSPDGAEIVFSGVRDFAQAIHRMTLGDPATRVVISDAASDGLDELDPDWQPTHEPTDNRPPIANAGPDRTAECASPQGAEVMLDGSGSSDPDSTPGTHDDIVSFEWFLRYGTAAETRIATGETAEVVLPLGTSVVTLRVTDAAGATSTDEVVWSVRDTVPPSISVSVDPSVLWPPNHQMVPVHATVTVTDACSTPSVVLAAVTSSEPIGRGVGKGPLGSDVQGAGIGTADFDLLLRAERLGNGPGRVYTIVYTATDAAGNTASSNATVSVPHDQGHRGSSSTSWFMSPWRRRR